MHTRRAVRSPVSSPARLLPFLYIAAHLLCCLPSPSLSVPSVLEGTMAEYRDEYGNPIRRDEYGNPSPEQYGGTTTAPQVQQPEKLHRSGSSSSSSSSEDDGHGGRRKKKGLKEKIKEKLPGGHKHAEEEKGYSGEHQEKKGMMEKIKEKLPGHHH